MQTAPAVWIADLNRQYIDMKKGEIHVSPFSFASQVQVDIEAITIINAFAIS